MGSLGGRRLLRTMSGSLVALAVALALVVVMSAWAGAPHATRAPLPTAASILGAVGSDAVAVPSGASVQPLSPTSHVVVSLSLVPPRSSELSQFLAAVENPASPTYRHFLSYGQYVQEFAPSAEAADTVVAALTAAGGQSVRVYPDHSSVSASLTPGQVRSLFGVELVQYATVGTLPVYTATGAISLPDALRGVVSAVNGLSDRTNAEFSWNLAASVPQPLSSHRDAGDFVFDNVSRSEWLLGSDYTQVFGATPLFPGNNSVPNATFPQKVAVATLLAGGYNASSGQDLPPWDPAVLRTYFNQTLAPTWPAPNVTGVPITIGSVTPPLPGSFGALNDTSLDEVENSLDLEMAGSLAPGASIVNFYFAGSVLANPPEFSSLADDFAQSLADALAYHYASARLAVVSCSFGLPDLNDSSWNVETAAAAATGVTLVVASGDQGNAPDSLSGRGDGPWPTWPGTAASNGSGAIAVGGVSLSIGGVPTATYNGGGSLNLSFDSNLTGIANVSAWYDAPPGADSVAGTEGGVSTVFPEPNWQIHSAAQPAIRNATIAQGAGTIGRAEPDVALPGNRTIATVFANASGVVFFTVLEGTSVAAPVFAGLLADVVAVESNRSTSGWAPLGFLDPELYRIASYYAAHPSGGDPFSDVTAGANYKFSASPGWDPLTGWGTVNASRLLAADENATVRSYAYNGSTPGLPPPPPASPSESIPWTTLYLIFGVGIATAVILVVVMARPSRSRPPATIPFGVHGGAGSPFGPGAQGGVYPGASFLCPYCGTVRPAEPVRCPQCGAF